MNDLQRQNVADSIYDSLDSMRRNGKTENMLKNAYIKFCLLYTSDAADEEDSLDFGGRRDIKKKNRRKRKWR